MGVVEVRGLVKEFAEGVRAVDGIDLATAEGEFLVLLGPSGCGKTTLLRVIAGLEDPTAGEVLIGGESVNGLPPRARRIAMVFQSYALYPHKTVVDNIVFPLKAAGLPKQEQREKADWAATMLGIANLLDRKPRHLSGGERQRVALARALVREPAAFLLDEPLSNLDAKLRATARVDLKAFQERIGTTTIYVTHDQVEAMAMGHRLAVMDGGRVRQLGAPVEVYRHPADTFVATFVGSPPMNLIERGDAVVGMRPERLLPASELADAGDTVAVTFRVDRLEELGSERHFVGTIRGLGDDSRAIAVLPSTISIAISPGEDHAFAVARDDLRWFDRSSGQAVPPRRL